MQRKTKITYTVIHIGKISYCSHKVIQPQQWVFVEVFVSSALLSLQNVSLIRAGKNYLIYTTQINISSKQECYSHLRPYLGRFKTKSMYRGCSVNNVVLFKYTRSFLVALQASCLHIKVRIQREVINLNLPRILSIVFN